MDCFKRGIFVQLAIALTIAQKYHVKTTSEIGVSISNVLKVYRKYSVPNNRWLTYMVAYLVWY